MAPRTHVIKTNATATPAHNVFKNGGVRHATRNIRPLQGTCVIARSNRIVQVKKLGYIRTLVGTVILRPRQVRSRL